MFVYLFFLNFLMAESFLFFLLKSPLRTWMQSQPHKEGFFDVCFSLNLLAPKWHASFEVFGKGRVDRREECQRGHCPEVLWQERLGTGHLNVLTN